MTFPNYKPVKRLIETKMEDIKFSREADENCAVMGYFTASSGNSLPTFRNKLLLGLLSLESVTDRLSRNVSKKLSLLAT
jgi:hypothetical protein